MGRVGRPEPLGARSALPERAAAQSSGLASCSHFSTFCPSSNFRVDVKKWQKVCCLLANILIPIPRQKTGEKLHSQRPSRQAVTSSQGVLSRWFGWLLSPKRQQQQDDNRSAPGQQPVTEQTPSAAQPQGVGHLVGVAETAKAPREVGRLMSLGRQAPAFGPGAYELVGPCWPSVLPDTPCWRFAELNGSLALSQVGELGSREQQGIMKLMRHRRSKDLFAVKFVKRGAGMATLCWHHVITMPYSGECLLTCIVSLVAAWQQGHNYTSVSVTSCRLLIQACCWTRMWSARS